MNTFHTPHSIRNVLWSILLIGLSVLTIFSCGEESLTGSQEMQSPSTTGNAMTTAEIQAQSKQMVQTLSPQEISKAFFAMVDKAAAMSAAEIDSLGNEEIVELGKPIILAFGNTVQFDKATLSKLDDVIGTVLSDPTPSTKAQHDQTASKIEAIISSSAFSKRSYGAQEIRRQLKRIESSRAPDPGDYFNCSDYFNQQGDTVYLSSSSNDHFGLANAICPAGSIFNILPGTHQGQLVEGSRNGNTWRGWAAILDGMNAAPSAFKNGMDNNTIEVIDIRNYTRHGIVSDGSTNVTLSYLMFENIAPDYCKTSVCGQNEGAIMFTNSENIRVQFSDFTNVASGIRFKHSTGPLVASNNEALNPGRNFFQCDNCQGSGIRVNNNSLEHTTGYGNTTLEDWINLFQSDGTSGDYIQVNNNRARVILNNGQATKVSNSGCMVILGDFGGEYQEAKNNIAVNPGNCGIGIASGNFINVQNNKMYSKFIDGISNVGFYSWKNPSEAPSCSHHTFEGNMANYIYAQDPNQSNYGDQNHAWTDGSCGNTQITDSSSVSINLNMGPEIWGMW